MPRTIDLPAEPKIEFGVFNHWGHVATPDNCTDKCMVGWRTNPFYGYGPRSPQPTRADAQRAIERNHDAWKRLMIARKRSAITMNEVLVDRIIQRVVPGYYGPDFVFTDDSTVQLRRTRGWQTPQMLGPTEGPFVIKRILATHRTFRLDNGESLVFDCKMHVDTTTVPEWILDQVFGP